MGRGVLLSTPACDLAGRVLGFGAALPGLGRFCARLRRIRRKRFLAELRGGGSSRMVSAVRLHPEGRDFEDALEAWLAHVSTTPLAPLEAAPVESAAEACRCSVVINTVGRPGELALTLRDLAVGWDSRDELLVVLGPGDSESAAVVAASPVPCRLLHCGVRNLAISRNIGLAEARGRFIAYIDDDASPESGWLDHLLHPLETDASAAVSAGFVLDGSGCRFLDRHVVSDILGNSRWFDRLDQATDFVDRAGEGNAFLRAVGCNMAFDRLRLLGCGGFDPEYRYFLEETDAALRLLRRGGRCVAAPDARVRHRLAKDATRSSAAPARDRLVIVLSQMRFLRRHAVGNAPLPELRSMVWLRVLEGLERIAWDCGSGLLDSGSCTLLQREYLSLLVDELRAEAQD